MPRTLYAKLAAVLVALLTSVGLLYVALSTSATRHYVQEVSQRVHRDLARNLVADRDLVEQGRLNDAALKKTFSDYMVINPSIEIYLLDLDGTILSYSADPGKVKRKRVALGPIRTFLSGAEEFPLLGDDPRSHDRRKAFSVTPVPSAADPHGYLYVVLRGEEFDAVDRLLRESHLARVSAWAVAGSLVAGLLAGLVIFHLLTRRLHRLATLMDRFERSQFTVHEPYRGRASRDADEIDRLGDTFDRMAQRIVSQLDELERKDALRRELVAQVSHDLRTPLASLRGYLESLELGGSSLSEDERAEHLAISLRQAEHLSRLVAELFELARLDAHETEPRCEPFPPAELVQDVVQKFDLRARECGVAIEVPSVPVLPLVSADVQLTERVLENLIENALGHTPRDGRVRISLADSGQRVEIRVADTGQGIAAVDLRHIFEPFCTARKRSGNGEHAGLGLAIARRIVALHGDEIRVASRPGHGATFAFSLPVWQG